MPSMCRWSKDTVSSATQRGLTRPLWTHGRSRNAPTARIADSPGLMIGRAAVDAEHADVRDGERPPGQVRRGGVPFAGGTDQAVQRRGELGERQPAGVLDVRHHEAPRSRRCDAEVDLVAIDDLLRVGVEHRIEVRVALDAQEDRPGDEQQGADADVVEARCLAQPSDQPHRPLTSTSSTR